MAYDFHYTPTGTGVISGKEVLEQTEDAINDLGNTAISGVQEALDKAEQALTNSENAVDDAQTALNTANNAEGVAIQAQTDVSNLSGTVTNIGNRVTTAEGNISNLQGRMTTAEGNITNLQGRMTTAETNIGNLQTAVSTAQATANSAQQTATTARQQSYVFRYSGTAITDNSTIAYSTIDNTDNIKSGDKILDVDGKLFEITAVDTTNQTVTVGTALIDLAQDSDVVHTSGNETVGGSKTFTNDVTVNNSNATVQADVPNLIFQNPLMERASTTLEGEQTILFTDKNDNNIGSIQAKTYTSGTSDIILTSYSETSDQSVRTTGIVIRRTPTTSKFHGYSDNITTLGDTNRRWKSVYATNYYYGSDNVEFSTKFVTTDTNQAISGNKTFSSNVNVYNSDSTGNVSNIVLKNSKAEVGTEFAEQSINFVDKNNNPLAKISCYGSNGSYTRLYITASDSNNNSDGIYIRKSSTGTTILPTTAGAVALGNSSAHFYNMQTSRVNGLTPSSLGMPVAPSSTSYVDISGYITVLDSSSANTYTPPSNGYITFNVTGNLVQIFHDYGLQGKWTVQAGNANRGFIPVLGGVEVKIYITASSVDKFWFIPCQGNI